MYIYNDLFHTDRIDESVEIIKRIAKVNGKQVPEEIIVKMKVKIIK